MSTHEDCPTITSTRARRFITRHPDVIGQYEKTLKLLESSLYSALINAACRIALTFLIQDDSIVLVNDR